MPIYEFSCHACAHEWEEGRAMGDTAPPPCPVCQSNDTQKDIRTAPGVQGDVYDWSNENGGKGRLISQLQHKPGKPPAFAYCKNRQEIFDKCAKKGWKVTKV